MPAANIQINGVTTTFATVPIGVSVVLSNADTGGELTYAWSIVDQPEGSSDPLSPGAGDAAAFTPTKQGSYQIKLVVNSGLGTQAIATAIVGVLDATTRERLPAATETSEASNVKGWSQAINRILNRANRTSVDGNVVVAVTPGGIAAGTLVTLSGISVINSGTQAQADVPTIATALGTTQVNGPVGILVDGVSPGDVGANKLVLVRMFGLVQSSGIGVASVGAPVYLGNVGQPALGPGLVSRQVGCVISASGGLYRWIIDSPFVPASGGGGPQLAGAGHFGSGRDSGGLAALQFDGVTPVTGWTLVGSVYKTTKPDWYYDSITIANGVELDMWVGGRGSGSGSTARFFAHVITIPAGATARITLNGADASGAIAPTTQGQGHCGGISGSGISGIQNAGQSASDFSGGNWWSDLRGGKGGFGGASATNAGSPGPGQSAPTILSDLVGRLDTWESAKNLRLGLANPGAISGGGGGGSGGGTTGIASGGGGGNGGGVMCVGIRQLIAGAGGTLVCSVKGGRGGDGQTAIGSNAGGGSGGGGGVLVIGYGGSSIPAALITDVSGGSGGNGVGTGSAGGTGEAGSALVFTLGTTP